MKYLFSDLAAAMSESEHQAAIKLGVSGSTEQQYRREGMSRDVAERKANLAGFHVYEVWPEMVEHDLEDGERAEEARKERRRQYRRAYYLANREKELAQQRERDRVDRVAKVKYARWYYRTYREDVCARQRERNRAKADRLRLLRRMELEQIPNVDREVA